MLGVTCVPCVIPADYHCAANGSWVNDELGIELPKCVPGNRAAVWVEVIDVHVGSGYYMEIANLSGKDLILAPQSGVW